MPCCCSVARYTSSSVGTAGDACPGGCAPASTRTSARPAIQPRRSTTANARAARARRPRATPAASTMPVECADRALRLAFARMRPCPMIATRGHRSATSSTMCVDRMTTTSSPTSASRFWKRRRSAGSRPAVGSSTIEQRRLAEQRLRDAVALLHAAREGIDAAACGRPTGSSCTQQLLDQRAAAAATVNAFQRREVSQHRFRRTCRGYAPNSCGR